MHKTLIDASKRDGGTVFAYHVKDPERYGVVEFDANHKVISIEEKPTVPKSNYAVPGIYFYDNSVVEISKNLKPSARGEYEITDINKIFLEDTGTFQSLIQAQQFVQVIEERQGLKIGCIEEIAYIKGFISAQQLEEIAKPLLKSGYGEYLINLLQ